MTVGIVGLGLIGASMAKTVKKHTDFAVMGIDKSREVMENAMLDGTIDGELDLENEKCDIVIVALYPDDIIEFVQKHANFLQETIVIDCGGTKTKVCDKLFPIAREKKFTFIGGHPMAGIEKSGYDYSTDSLFDGAFMILVPDEDLDRKTLDYAKMFFISLGFHRITVTTAKEHDKIIAYTSQLAHIASSAYVKSPTSMQNLGFSAGSFKDMTRVAYLNENMWSELFLQNKEYLLTELEELMENLKQYHNAISQSDRKALLELLSDGKQKRIAAWTAVENKKK
ncbi:MAG: prephenate dehydrogenase/arogenate dehydrogenase family protein [Clostridia bacterium]|nr:prephenate dehydrogenase/arogenate dehydrogenase family protein [Clostridia bacterium]